MEVFLAVLCIGIGFTVARFYDRIKAMLNRKKIFQEKEYQKCMDSPYYFFTTYWRVMDTDEYGNMVAKQVRINEPERVFNERMLNLMHPRVLTQYSKIKLKKSNFYD